MISKKLFCLINARGGSKRIKNKNIVLFKSKPLIYWTIKAAIESKKYDQIFVNTDSKRISVISKQYGAKVPFLRPKYLADDKTTSVESTKYFLNKINESADYFNLLQPTSPLRTKVDISNFHNFIKKHNFKSVVSISKLINHASGKYLLNSDFTLRKINEKHYNEKIDIFYLNGSMYYNDINLFLKHEKFIFRYTKGFRMSKSKSIDIDTFEDFNKALKISK